MRIRPLFATLLATAVLALPATAQDTEKAKAEYLIARNSVPQRGSRNTPAQSLIGLALNTTAQALLIFYATEVFGTKCPGSTLP